jgi:hypothetical protein
MSDKTEVGLYEKFRVERTDGKSAEGEKHHGCDYFVLDLSHDPYAYAAIVTYARKCSDKYPALADDLLARASKMIPWMAEQQMDEWTPEHREEWARFGHNDPERR